jgi:hypothetical protein
MWRPSAAPLPYLARYPRHIQTKNARALGGISLSPPKVPDPKKSCKDKGRETDARHFEENSQNFSEDPPRVERFSENDEKVPEVPESAGEASRPPSEDDYLDGPATFEEDGLTIFYVRERSERRVLLEGSLVDKSRSVGPDFGAFSARTLLKSGVILYQSSGYLRSSIDLTK